MELLKLSTARKLLAWCLVNLPGATERTEGGRELDLEINGWPAEVRILEVDNEVRGKLVTFSLISNSTPPGGYPLSYELAELVEELNDENEKIFEESPLSIWHLIEPSSVGEDRLDLKSVLMCGFEDGIDLENISEMFQMVASVNAQLNLKAVQAGFLA